MSCDRERLSAWFDGALDERENVALERHVADCPRCQAWLHDMERLLVATEADETAPPLAEGTMRRVLARCPEAPAPGLAALWRAFWKTRVQVPLPAMALGLALLAAFLLRLTTAPGPDRLDGASPRLAAMRSVPSEGTKAMTPYRLARHERPSSPRDAMDLAEAPSPRTGRPIPIRTITYDPDREPQEEETVAAPPLPPFFTRRPRGRWVVIEERYDRPLPSGDGSY